MTLQGGSRGAPIRFGTSGWRGILGEELTFPRVRLALHAAATWILEQRRGRRVVVAYDTRFQSSRMAEIAEGVLSARGLAPLVTREAVPTPVASHAVTRRRAAAGLVFTASHNPPEYHGLKVIGHRGGAIEADDAHRIERLALEVWGDPVPHSPVRRPPAGPRADFTAAYTRDLLSLLDRDALRAASPRVVYDAMHGVGAGVLSRALRRSGVEVRLRRGRPDPRFGGGPPDPGPGRLRVLAREVRSLSGLRLGLATDGDADRFGVIDADGRMLRESEVLALLVDHLARTGRARRGVAVSLATGTLVERVASGHGLGVVRRPIGFKHLSRALTAGEADLAGDESGGFAFAPLGCDKDGVLAGCLVAELLASTRAPLRRRLAELQRRFGRMACGRTAHRLSPRLSERLEKLVADPPGRLDGCAVRVVSAGEGLRLALDDGFLMLRVSGTEPVLRVYAEAPGPRELRRRLAAGAALLDLEPHG